MKHIILFSQEESSSIDYVIDILNHKKNIEEISNIEINKQALQEIANSISKYPSIFHEQHLGKTKRTIETLINSLCSDVQKDIRFHIPTKAVLGNAFIISKINFFFMLYYISIENPELCDSKDKFKDIIKNLIYSMMAEEVFLSIIEDKVVLKDIRIKAGYLLSNIWEYRLNHGIKEFAPILSHIWKARASLLPTFGTMLGFSELFKISENVESSFFSFLQRDELTDHEVQSIEEFIFGLSYEETEKIQKDMSVKGKSTVSQTDIEKTFGIRIYPEYDQDDPREIYRSFTHRKINARNRARFNLPGPQKTLEEYLMCYLLFNNSMI
jgi:hypothetical protein